ncbi:MAG: DNA polymerase III subunit beta [Spirochaetia bacterium]|jgi:DNA polymerase-3 subunit beta|nr:DNA polymerase III subunit beta [Spirochaetia bacterium]
MKFTCNKNSIINEISIAQDIISSRNALSILSNVLIEADTNSLVVKATDLKVGFETRIPVSVETPGSTTVYCDKFLGILRAMPEGDITFTVENQKLDIRSSDGNINFQLKIIESEKYPSLKNVSDDSYFSISQKDLIEMINQTIFAVSDDETRYFMNGVYLESRDGKIIMVATDGRRLSLINKESSSLAENFESIIIPVKILGLIKKLASGEGEFLLAVSEKTLFIKFDNNKIYSNLIEGQFPNYQRVIPEKQEHMAIIGKNELLSALRRVSVLAEQKSKRVYIQISENRIEIYTEESDIGTAREILSCQYSGDEYTLVVNYMYLLEPVKVMEEDDVSIKFTESSKAITVNSVPERDYFHIVMPMQV